MRVNIGFVNVQHAYKIVDSIQRYFRTSKNKNYKKKLIKFNMLLTLFKFYLNKLFKQLNTSWLYNVKSSLNILTFLAGTSRSKV